MFHIALTPDYSPSNALSAQHETLIGAIAELLGSINLIYGPEEWYVNHILRAIHEAVDNLENEKTAKASWTDMGMEDDTFSIDIFTHDEAKYARHDGHKWLAPHGAVGFVADPLHEQWLYDQAEIADWENVLIPKPFDAVEIAEEMDPNQLRDTIANSDLDVLIVNRRYAEIRDYISKVNPHITIEQVMVIVDQLASKDSYFLMVAKTLCPTGPADVAATPAPALADDNHSYADVLR